MNFFLPFPESAAIGTHDDMIRHVDVPRGLTQELQAHHGHVALLKSGGGL